MGTMLSKNRFDNVKPFYKHLNILPLTKNNLPTGEIHVEALS